ncbi:hypothetical protein OG598_19810 [Micromonospora sp. NBC_00330]|uniref:hypothetical protein n=1 Tax=Micromonospora sp. NBC_00330 TaxID=2903585 RepID=UPI002E2D3276|nr:hypothetical protein [Micromonospora sp. NBC_00330]
MLGTAAQGPSWASGRPAPADAVEPGVTKHSGTQMLRVFLAERGLGEVDDGEVTE